MRQSVIYLVLFMLTTLVGCKERYEIDVKSAEESMLVVEGWLNSGPEPTNISLTKTFRLDDTAVLRAETGANITVEGKDNTIQLLQETAEGSYSNPLNLLVGKEYRVRIHTTNGKEYLSDYVLVKNSPEIDSISWKRDATGVTIYANTHDPTNDTRYYKWDYVETHELRSNYYSYWIYENEIVRPRNMPDEDVYFCWRTIPSSNIYIGTSSQLSEDLIYEFPLVHIPDGAEKLSVRYSIIVKQTTLSKTGFEYLQLMKKNSESIGTIFDPQPSELRGNIYCISNPDEIAIGFMTASAYKEKRIFIASRDVPRWGFRLFCTDIEVANHRDSILKYFSNYLPYAENRGPGGGIVSYQASTSECVDCRTRGGITIRPSFW